MTARPDLGPQGESRRYPGGIASAVIPSDGLSPAPGSGGASWPRVLNMPRVGRNAAFNTFGRAWTMLMSFVFVPFYIDLLGIEAYGIIGFFATLLAVFSFLDLGLPTTLSRELARRAATPEERGTMRSVVRTLEWVYGAMGLIIGLTVIALAGPIASRWLNVSELPVAEVENAIRLMGIVIACQWPMGLYSGGLLGLQRQVMATGLQMASMTVRGVGGILVLAFVENSLTAFFTFQALVSLATTVGTRLALTKSLPLAPAAFDRDVLATVWKFALGMTGASILTIALMQADKVLLSALLPLEEYALYVLAYTLAAAGGFIGGPVFNAVFPRLTELVAAGDEAAVRHAFVTQAQLLSMVLAPLALMVILFAPELILFWTRDAAIVEAAAPIARTLAVGVAFNSVMLIPYALTLAHGKSHYALISNAVAVAVLVPIIYLLATRHGAFGAAFAWPILNIGYVLILAPILFHLLLPGGYLQWLARCLLLQAGAALLPIALIRLATPGDLPPLAGFLIACAAGVLGLAAAALSTRAGRRARSRDPGVAGERAGIRA